MVSWGCQERSGGKITKGSEESFGVVDSFIILIVVMVPTWPSASAGSTSEDSINLGSKIFRRKIPGSSQKQHLNLPHKGNYLHSIYSVFITIYITLIIY